MRFLHCDTSYINDFQCYWLHRNKRFSLSSFALMIVATKWYRKRYHSVARIVNFCLDFGQSEAAFAEFLIILGGRRCTKCFSELFAFCPIFEMSVLFAFITMWCEYTSGPAGILLSELTASAQLPSWFSLKKPHLNYYLITFTMRNDENFYLLSPSPRHLFHGNG